MAYLWLNRLLALLLPELEHLPAGPQGEAQARAWFERLLARLVERGLSTPAQQKNRVVDARNAIRARFGDDHPSLAYVGFDERTWQQINLPAHDRTEARNENQRLLRQPEKIVARAAKLLESPRFEDLAVGLGVTVGRRISELLDGHAKLEPATAWSVLFTGQRKHKGDREDFSFEVPTLAPAEKVLGAWQRLLVMLGDEVLNPQSINNRYGHQVNQAADRHFRGLVPPRLPKAEKGKEGGVEDPHGRKRSKDALYLHLFRAVYATIAVHWFCPPKVNRLVFKAEIQGHRQILDAPTQAMRRSYTASRHYDDYQVADASGKNLDGRQGIKLGQWPGLEVLGVFRDGGQPKETSKPKVTPIPVPPEQAEEATAVPSPPAPQSLDSPPTAVAPPPTSPDAPMPTKEPTINTFGTAPAPAQDDGGGVASGQIPEVPEVPMPPKEKKPRPVTYRIYPADRPRLDAFRTDPKQTQADNLQQVVNLLENASAAIRDQDKVQAQLREAQAKAEQAAAERDQARLEAQDAAGRLQALEGELRRLQQALEQAQAQIAAAGSTKAGGGNPVALAVVARELLSLATEAECPAGLQAKLITLATQALRANQDGAGAARTVTATAQTGQKKVTRAAVDPARFGPLFAAGATTPPKMDASSQDATPQTTAPLQEESVAQPTDGGGDTNPKVIIAPQTSGDAHPKGTIAHSDQDAQEPPEGAEVNKGPVVPRVFTRRGGAGEKLERALGAVLAHNEAQTSRDKKWAVTESALARLTGCFRPAVRSFFAGKAQEIEEHNQRHHLTGGHNAARGKRGETIEAEVHWRGESLSADLRPA